MTPTSAVLKTAFALFNNGENWIQGPWAVDAQRNEVGATNPTAVSFCTHGAITRAAEILEEYASPSIIYLVAARDELGIVDSAVFVADATKTPNTIFYGTYWNDRPGTTFELVEAVFARAIEIAERDEAALSVKSPVLVA